MAPSTSAQALQGNRPRPSANKRIIPAIPLPYIQKRKENIAAAARKSEIEEKRATSPPVVSSEPSSPLASSKSDAFVAENSEVVSTLLEDDISTQQASATPDVEQESPTLETASPQSVTVETPAQDKAHDAPSVALARNDSADSHFRDDQQPLVPVNMNSGNQPTKNSRQTQFPPNAIHHTNASAGSLVFGGGYPESSNSSPAPPLSAGGMPAFPLQPHPEGNRGPAPPYLNGSHMHTFSNGYSPMGPPGSAGHFSRQDMYMHQNLGPENYARRPPGAFPPPEVFSPGGAPPGFENPRAVPFNPSTAQSFHGSQSSAANEQEVTGPPFYNQYPQAAALNGGNTHSEDLRQYQQPRPKPRTGSQNVAPGPENHYPRTPISMVQMAPPMDDLDGLITYLQAQFAEPEFADYTLELRYKDDRAKPVQIPGHNLLFARSPTLKNLMAKQAHETNSNRLAERTIFIHCDDRFIRSDAFWMAVQRLYGGQLLIPGPNSSISTPVSSHNSMAGSPNDRFEFALGYAAAGHLLRMPPLVGRGINVASHFLSWQTVEIALDFSMEGGLDQQWTLEPLVNASNPKYGPDVNYLINCALQFIITGFPPNFDLDTTVTAPLHNRRLPFVPSHRQATASRFTGIRFGDHTREDEPSTPANPTNAPLSILSRILLNLPFQLLKYILESSRLGNVSGWATAALRQNVMYAVIEEREKRRIKVLTSTANNDTTRQTQEREWNAVGWKEFVSVPKAGTDKSVLDREWVGYQIQNGN